MNLKATLTNTTFLAYVTGAAWLAVTALAACKALSLL